MGMLNSSVYKMRKIRDQKYKTTERKEWRQCKTYNTKPNILLLLLCCSWASHSFIGRIPHQTSVPKEAPGVNLFICCSCTLYIGYLYISGTQFTLSFKCVGNTTGLHSELFVEILSRGRNHLCDIQCNRILRECLPLLELKLGSQDVLNTSRSLEFAVKQSKAEMSSHSTVCQMIHDPGTGWGEVERGGLPSYAFQPTQMLNHSYHSELNDKKKKFHIP